MSSPTGDVQNTSTAGDLSARKIDASNRHWTAEVKSEIETEDGVLVIRRIHVVYHITAPPEAQETIERVHSIHAEHCPVYRSLHKAIDITTEGVKKCRHRRLQRLGLKTPKSHPRKWSRT